MLPHTRAIAASLLLCALAVFGCATTPPHLPYGGEDTSQEPDSDSLAELFVDAQRPCQMQTPIVTAKALVRGTLEKRRINASFWVGVDAGTGRLRLESLDTGRRSFRLLANYSYSSDGKDEATLVLPAKQWVVRSRSREVVEVLLGVPLSGLDLQSVLVGCPILTGGTLRFERFDAHTAKMVAIGNDTVVEVFMRRRSITSPWTMFATVVGVPRRSIRWRADPGRRSGGVLESVRLTSLEWNGTAGRLFDLTFSLDRIQTPATAPDMFTLPIPDSASDLEIDAVALNVSVPLLAD